ncbi:retention module-containing protein, partial [Idiomarina sp. Sol25]|uniref:retention module-containing protein n=1 Tax=Idiomarina sp. Sol25 TaxID=3064000 RepID=UPI00294B8786
MIATIVRIEGNVQVQRADGSIENLAVGDQLFEGDVVLTESNSNVVLEYPNDEQVLIQGGASFAITREQLPDDDSVDDLEFIADESSADDILNVLDETDGDLLEQFQAPAAGNAAAGGDTGSNFVRLARVLETVYDTPIGLTPVEIAGGDITAAAVEQPDPGAVSSGTINLTAEYDQGGSGLTLSGTTTNLPPASTVSLLLTDSQGNQFTLTTTTNADGSYSVSGVDLTSLNDGNITIQASAVDATGETITDSDAVVVDETAGNLTVTSDVTDGNITVSGTSTDMAEGTEVAITITDANGDTVTATATIAADGTYTVDADISGLVDGQLTINAKANDNNGTEQSASTNDELDTTAPGDGENDGNSIAFGDADDLINSDEQSDIGFTGQVEDGATVDSIVITDGTTEIVVADSDISVDDNGNVTVNGQDLSDLADGELTVTMTVTDEAGNQGSVTDTATLDTSAEAGTVSVNNITSDDVLNAQESNETITVSGSASGGDIAEGDSVAMTINGEDYTTTVDENGEWSVDVAGSDLAADTEFDVVVSSSDDAGNTVDSTATSTHTVDTSAPGDGNNSIAFGDDLINSDEQSNIGFTGQVEDGATVEGIVISDGTTEIVVADSDISVDDNGNVTVTGQDLSTLTDGELTVTMTVTDAAGNEGSVTDTATLDTSAEAGTVSVNNITDDDVINAQESNETITVSGSASGGDIAEGDSVAMTINGTEYTTTVDENGEWSVDVAGSDLAADTEFEVVVSSSDDAGNTVDSTATSTHTVDTQAGDDNSAPTVTITEDANDDGVI